MRAVRAVRVLGAGFGFLLGGTFVFAPPKSDECRIEIVGNHKILVLKMKKKIPSNLEMFEGNALAESEKTYYFVNVIEL